MRWTCSDETTSSMYSELEIGQLLLQAGHGVLVEQRDDADHDVVALIAFVLQQELMEHVVDRLRAAFEAARLDHAVEIAQQILGQRYADPADRPALGERAHAQLLIHIVGDIGEARHHGVALGLLVIVGLGLVDQLLEPGLGGEERRRDQLRRAARPRHRHLDQLAHLARDARTAPGCGRRGRSPRRDRG